MPDSTSGISRRQFVRRCAGFGAAMAVSSALSACSIGFSYKPTTEPDNADLGLKEVAGQKSVLFGAATMQATLLADPSFAAAFANHVGLLAPENDLKWETVEPQPGIFNFAPGDWLADFAAQHDMLFRGHCLVWHQQIPSWAGANVSAAAAAAQLTSHITETASHFAGRMHSWDVVNEAINPEDGRSDGLRKTRWLQTIGPSYIELAFRTAAEADPHALLTYNDYGLELDSSDGDRRRAGTLKLLSGLLAAGVPVHALGIQAHLRADVRFNATKLTDFIQHVADLGLQIFITELDVADRALPADIQTRDSVVANVYQDFLQTVLAQPAVKAIITWGLSDRYTWLSQYAPRFDGQPVRPLPLDASMKAKPALWAVMDALNATEARASRRI